MIFYSTVPFRPTTHSAHSLNITEEGYFHFVTLQDGTFTHSPYNAAEYPGPSHFEPFTYAVTGSTHSPAAGE
jgi:hypothetical protein